MEEASGEGSVAGSEAALGEGPVAGSEAGLGQASEASEEATPHSGGAGGAGGGAEGRVQRDCRAVQHAVAEWLLLAQAADVLI